MDLLRACLEDELEMIVGAANVVTEPGEMIAQSVDVWWISRFMLSKDIEIPKPFAIVYPTNKEEVCKLVKFCNEHKIPLVPKGGGAGDSGGSLPIKSGIVVDLKRMDKVIELNEKSLTVRVQPGIFHADLEEYLTRYGYTTNHLPASLTTSTVGGFISTNGTGVLSSKYGKMSDMVHQLEIVLPNGHIFNSLPVRLHSTGPDYSRLFIGAEGTLGIITEALIKIHPLPEKRGFRTFLLPQLKGGIEAGRKIMVRGLNPSLVRLYDEADTQVILKNQFGLEEKGCCLLLGFDGPEKLVDVSLELAADTLLAEDARDLGPDLAKNWWDHRYRSYFPPNDYVFYPWMTTVMDTVAPYEKIEAIYWGMKSVVEDGFKEWNAEFHAHFSHWYNWGTSFYPSFLIKEYPVDPREAFRLYNQVLDRALSVALDGGGVVNEHHGIGLRMGRLIKKSYGEQYELANMIKHTLDPNNIMNPGKLGLGE